MTKATTSIARTDVLADAVNRAGQSPDSLRIIRMWLAEQLVAHEYAKLGQGGHTSTQVPLRQVFIDLPISLSVGDSFQAQEMAERPLFLESLLAAKPVDLRSAFRSLTEGAAARGNDETEESEEVSDLLEAHRDYGELRPNFGATLLIGGPGQGKSTLGQLACQLHRAALIHPASSELTQAQRDLVNSFVVPRQDGEKRRDSGLMDIVNGPLLPLQISLPEFAVWAAGSEARRSATGIPSLLLFLAELPSARLVELDAARLFELVCQIPSLLVLDGFDEVGATQDRARIVTAARELLTALAKESAKSQILATTRPQGYADELAQVGIRFQKTYLAPLTKDEALHYATKLIEAKLSGIDQQHKALRQIHEAAKEPATERLLTTPLQVTILTALVQQLGRAPRERWNLFSRYFAYTFDREIERNTYASALLAEHRSHIERIHARVALLLQVDAERDGGASARMTKERLQEVISEVLAEDEVAKDQKSDLVRDIASAAENRLVFLVEPEPGKFGYEIRSLQEFMAAWALTSGRDAEIEARLYQVAKAPMFRNVTLFILSRLFSEGSPLRDVLAGQICKDLDEDSTDEISRLAKPGGLLALETLEEGAALSQPKRARALMGRAAALFALPPGHEHVRIARVADEETWPVLRVELEKVLSGSSLGSLCLASAWICIIDAANSGNRYATELGNKHWSASAATPLLFGAFGRQHVLLGDWIAKKLEEASGEVSPLSFVYSFTARNKSGSSPNWAYWLASVYSASGNWRFKHRDGFVWVSPRRGSVRPPVAPPAYSPPDSDLWRAWIACAAFENDPSALNLAVALEHLQAITDRSTLDFLQWRSSWPLAVCISSASSISDLGRFATLSRTGVLGDKEEWVNAEARWKGRLDLVELLKVEYDSSPWSLRSIATSRPFMNVAPWEFQDRLNSSWRKSDTVKLLARAKALFLQSKNSSVRRRLADVCLVLWKNLPAKIDRTQFDPSVWLKASEDGASFLIPRPKGLPVKEWRALLDVCLSSGTQMPYEPAAIFEALAEMPEHPVLLKLAARTFGMYVVHDQYLRDESRLALMRKVIEKIGVDQSVVSESGAYLGVLRIWLGMHSAVNDTDLCRSIVAAAGSDPQVWSCALVALRVSSLPPVRIESVLGRLYSAMGVDSEYAPLAMSEIRDALQKRTSDLDSVATWNRLALPLPHPKRPLQPRMEGGIPTAPVYISSVDIQDIGGIRKMSMEFAEPAEAVGQWVVVIGPNGSGKTTLLRSLALALRSVKDPSIWPKGAFGPLWQRIESSGEEEILSSRIVVTLGDGSEHRTLVRAGSTMSISQLPEQDQPSLFPIFAYGCRRGSALGGASREVKLDETDGPEIATLFDEGADLIQAETWLVALEGDTGRSPKSKMIYESVIYSLKRLMRLESVDVASQRLWVTEFGKTRVPFSRLSDGYLTSAGWFLDLVARWLTLAERCGAEINGDFLSRMRGLVLIDEIDLHLHPQWQVDIISRTREMLPQMSFVVTTHNPLTLVGAKAEEIWILGRDASSTKAVKGSETPMLMTGGQIYHQYFGINDIYPNALGRLLQRYSYLSGFALRSDQEQHELEEIQRKLSVAGVDPGWEIVPREVFPT